jgi:hypothetical protein
MEFYLTYAGALYSTGNLDVNRTLSPKKTTHIHDIRKVFHKQLKQLWRINPILKEIKDESSFGVLNRDGFVWKCLANQNNKLLCALDLLFLRPGDPGQIRIDIDNRLKTIFDALRAANGSDELRKEDKSLHIPSQDENPFCVLLEEDSLITDLRVSTGTLLEQFTDVPFENSIRVFIKVRLYPNSSMLETNGFA